MRQTEKAIVQGGHVASDDEEDDAGVVELVAPLGDVLRVIHECVEGGAHAEAEEGAAEETREDKDVGAGGGGVARRDDAVEPGADEGEDEGADGVRPDVDGLVVHVEKRREGPPVAVALLAVPRPDEVVVPPPRRQVVPEHQQRLLHILLRLLRRLDDPLRRGGRAPLAELGARRPEGSSCGGVSCHGYILRYVFIYVDRRWVTGK